MATAKGGFRLVYDTIAAATVADPVIRVEIGSALWGRSLRDRFNVMSSGRVMSAAAIEEVRLQEASRGAATGLDGQASRAATCAMPDGSPGRHRALHFNLPRIGDSQFGQCRLQILARTEEDFEHVEDFEIEVTPGGAGAVSFVSDKIRTANASDSAPPYAVIFTEHATIDGKGILTVEGRAVACGPIQSIAFMSRRGSSPMRGPGSSDRASPPSMRPIRMRGSRDSAWSLRAMRRSGTRKPMGVRINCPLACLRFFEPNMVYETANTMLKPGLRGLLPNEHQVPIEVQVRIEDQVPIEVQVPSGKKVQPAGKPARKAKLRPRQPVIEPA
jgi:hypothetical protein